MPPKVIARSADRTGGVLPVNATTRAMSAKSPAVRLKLEVRRLPPGLTLAEFEETLGEEWRLAGGKVDWREYRQGKSRASGSGKVPEQSRCYLHVLNEALVQEFEKRFLEVIFHDRAGTHKNPDLKHLQPTLGFAPNQRTPLQQAKQRTDNRQGTVDQDPEFIAFLEAETQPIAKPPALEGTSADNESEKREVKSTPLIDDLREKKANKAKAAQAKAEKAEKDKKAQQAKSTSKEANAVVEKDGGRGAQQQKVEQAAKEAAKVLNKQAAGKQQQQQQQQPPQSKTASPSKSKKQVQSPKAQNATPAQPVNSPGTPSPAPQRAARQRGNADGIKKMLQKDLGIRPKATQNTPSKSTTTATSPPATTDSSVQQPPAAATTSKAARETKAAPASAVPSEPKQPPTKAYLKHANPSQGMTEILIQQALSQYGELTNVTIDPRRGTAIAVFKQNEGLKKALEAKRITVANGAVEVLEFKDRSSGSGQAGRGGFKGGRGGRSARGGGQSGTSAGANSPAPPAN